MDNKVKIIIGAYGSGKSEYSINYAWNMHEQDIPVTLVDLDVVNPYFRSREVRDKFAKDDILVIAPDGEYSHGDLPMLSPRIMGAVEDMTRLPILDVGGDPAGCRTMARYVNNIKKRGYELKVVVNTKRPFTSTLEGIITMLEALEEASRLKVTELICNTNLMEYTDKELVAEGIRLVQQAAEQMGVKFEQYLVLKNFAQKIPDGLEGKKRYVLQYFLNKPWEKVILKGI